MDRLRRPKEFILGHLEGIVSSILTFTVPVLISMIFECSQGILSALKYTHGQRRSPQDCRTII